jgi:hypothetical protein
MEGKEIYILLMLALLCWRRPALPHWRRPVASLAAPRHFTGGAPSLHWRRPVGDALLACPGRPCLPNSNLNAAYSQQGACRIQNVLTNVLKLASTPALQPKLPPRDIPELMGADL